MFKNTIERLFRRKIVTFDDTALPRVLGLLDLTALGVGSTVGVGFYVLAGEVAYNKAGPAVVISFLIAGIASVLAGLCFAEFGGRVPKAGSAYIYTYVCVGEFIAFIIGWNLVLEYVIGTASVASGFSGYIDAMANNKISEALTEAMPMNGGLFGEYPNFLAAGLVAVVTIMLALGVKESSLANNIVTTINLFVIVFVIIFSATLADPDNWHLTPDDLNATCGDEENWGTGGFSPYGFQGIMNGAAACFYGFVGFDVIASTGEEAKRPERNLPLSICIALFIIFLSYFGMSTTLTLASPYCQLDPSAPLIVLYEEGGYMIAMWIVTIGSIFGFSASLFGAIFPLPRIIYAMATDGLLFRSLSIINKRFQSPMLATIIAGLFAALMALLFDLSVLIDMMSIGTLQAYSIVALCVMMLRYSIDPLSPEEESLTSGVTKTDDHEVFSFTSYLNQAINRDGLKKPNRLSTSFVGWATLLYLILSFTTALLLVVYYVPLTEGDGGAIAAVACVAILACIVVVCIALQPQSSTKLNFMVPFVPVVPALSTFINMYLMCNLDGSTWKKFAVWMGIGLSSYFFYSVWYNPPPLKSHDDDDDSSYDNMAMNGAQAASEDPAAPIPVITVVPATPQPSAHNTPQSTVPKMSEEGPKRPSKEIVVSPLVTAELLQKAKEAQDSQASDNKDQSSDDSSDDDNFVSDNKDLTTTNEVVAADTPDSKLVPHTTVALVSASQNLNDEEKLDTDSNKEAKKPKPKPLHLDLEQDEKEGDSIKSSSSAPALQRADSSSPSAPPTAIPKSFSYDTSSSSVPASPVSKRAVNPHKPLKRGTSFEFIPPSTPDSPGSQRLGHFVVTPVQEPSSPDWSPNNSDSEDQQKKKKEKKNKGDATAVASSVIGGTDKDEKDSGDIKNSSSGSEDLLKEISQPVVVSQTREFKRVIDVEDSLEPIRERGESKLILDDADKSAQKSSDSSTKDDKQIDSTKPFFELGS